MQRRLTLGQAVNYAILLIFVFLCILPFYYVVVVSLSEPTLVKEGRITILPQGFSLRAYEIVLAQDRFFNAFQISTLRTAVGLVVSLFLQCTMAYALSRKALRGRKFFILFVVFTILFSAGIIPTYLVVRYTGIINTFWALIIPDAISAWNVLILLSFFSSIPDAIEESAKMDGANDFQVFWKLMIPLSIPAVSTIGLFIAVHHWNSLMDGIMYINQTSLKPLQVYLMDLVMRSEMTDMNANIDDQALPSLSIQTAAIFAATLPVLLVYPFIQRYFTKGIMLGAIKG